MRRRSIRFRMTLWYSLALAAGLVLFALAIWVSLRHSLLRDLDNSLVGHARSLEVFINAELRDPSVKLPDELDEYSHGFPAGTSVLVKDRSGEIVFSSDRAFQWPPSGRDGKLHRVRWRHHDFRMLTANIIVQGRPWQLQIAGSLDSIEALLQRLELLLLTLVPAIGLIASLGGNWLSRRALKPVDEITAAAQSIGITNLSERLAVPPTGDELQRLSETWNSMLGRLEAAVKRLSRFTADASHELRTPLAVIRATAEIASRKSRSAESYREALGKIVLESERMTQLVEDLLFLARFDSEAVEMPMCELDLSPILSDVCLQVNPLAQARAVRLKAQLPPEGMRIAGNELALRRLILVLLDNAIKYSPNGGEVEVRLLPSPGEQQLEVADSGPGIADGDLQQIFERFYRAPMAREINSTGNGLGLSLAAGIAKSHNARIAVKRNAGSGSTFCVAFQQ